ncbi:hypothetical protein SLE2022_304380 [Rubroshorea leprosula]
MQKTELSKSEEMTWCLTPSSSIQSLGADFDLKTLTHNNSAHEFQNIIRILAPPVKPSPSRQAAHIKKHTVKRIKTMPRRNTGLSGDICHFNPFYVWWLWYYQL